jgi:hypothetical protein
MSSLIEFNWHSTSACRDSGKPMVFCLHFRGFLLVTLATHCFARQPLGA